MPAVAGLKKQGANNGACLAFLISTPETGVDSIALTYSLLDPIITVLRPVTAFVTAFVAGIAENFFGRSYAHGKNPAPDRTCLVDGCCDGVACDPKDHAHHHTLIEKFQAGMRFAFDELVGDLAVWFLLGIILAGMIVVFVPESLVSGSFGSGILGYLGMLAVSLPMYICATLSTPVAAALVMKGMSPGAALVLLMAGPATNMATITMVGGMLGKRTLGIYLGAIVVCTLAFAYLTDMIYTTLGVSAKVAAGAEAGEFIPLWLEWGATIVLAALIIRVFWKKVAALDLASHILARTKPIGKTAVATCCCEEAKPGST